MRCAVVTVFLLGCKITSVTTTDASPPEPDGYVLPSDAPPCRADSYDYVGDLVDFEYTEDRGIANATLTVRTDPTRSAVTSAIGRFTLCAPYTPFIADIDAPADYLDGQLVNMLPVGGPIEIVAPAFTATRLGGLLARFGQTFDPTAGIVVVSQPIAAEPLRLTGTSSTPVTNRTGPWVAGNDGAWIVFSNVTPGMQTLAPAPAGSIGGLTLPVEAGRITWVAQWYAPI